MEAAEPAANARRVVAVLVTYTWRPEGEVFLLREGKNFVGAGKTSEVEGNRNRDVYLPHDAALSAEHALIVCRQGKFHVYDQRSSNGTFLDGELVPLQGGTLENYSSLLAGRTTWTFVKLSESTSS